MYIQDATTLSLHLWPLQKVSPAITHIRPVIRLRHLAPRLPRVNATGQHPPFALLGRAQAISMARLLEYTLIVEARRTRCIGKELRDQPSRGTVATLSVEADVPSVQLLM
jgi:hypothetical protein